MTKKVSVCLAAPALVGAIALVVSCTASTSRSTLRTMPSPDGCYMQVWDQPRFTGRSDFINGPRRYEHLRDLPGRHNWRKQIRSISLGPTAIALGWSAERFEGFNVLMTGDQRAGGRFPTVAVAMQSLEIRCSGTTGLLADGSEQPHR